MNLVIVTLANGADHQRYTTYICNRMVNEANVLLICTAAFDITKLNSKVTINNSLNCLTSRIELSALSINTWKSIYKTIYHFQPDLIHFMTAHPLNLLVVIIFPLIEKWFTIHDVEPHPGEKVGLAIKIYNSIVIRIANKILVHSSLALRQLEPFAYKGKVMPLAGVEAPKIKAKLGSTVLFFGRIRPYKGPDLFIDAAEQVINELPETKFVIAGEGDLSEYILRIRHKENFIIINRFITEKETELLFTNCKFVVLPYRSATQSGIVPLAYSFCRPIIGTRVGAIPEMVQDKISGILCDPSTESIASAIYHLLQDDTMCNWLAKGAINLYQKKFSSTNMTEAFKNLYCTELIRKP